MLRRPSPEEHRTRREAERAANLRALCQPSRSIHRAVVGGSTSGERIEKTEPKRNPALLEMAAGRRCLLLAVEGCRGASGDTTVAAHSNLGIHGKAKSRKADDCYSVWACDCCHRWLDTSGSAKAEKERAFMAAHLRQVLEWRQIATDASEPPRFRRAAQWALDQLAASVPQWREEE